MNKSTLWLLFFTIIAIFSCTHDPLFTPQEAISKLVYSPDSLAVEVGTATSSVKPKIAGTEPITFNLSTTPTSGGNITIDEKGVIIVDSNLQAGKYLISVIATNDLGAVSFSDIYTVRAYNAAQPPSLLVYTPSSVSVLAGNSYTTSIPNLQGTGPFTFSILSTPALGKISIDNQGVISTTQALAEGSYPLNIEVTNSVANVTFNAAMTIDISNTPLPPSGLSYATDTLIIDAGSSGSSLPPNLSGTWPFTFTLSSSPNAGTAITASNNGSITTNSDLPIGTYNISVTVGNSAGLTVFSDIYTIIVNEVPAVTFTNDIEPLFTQKCANCHTTGPQTNYTDYTNASANINLILDRVQRIPGRAGFMPKNGTALTANEIQMLNDWLAQGLPQ